MRNNEAAPARTPAVPLTLDGASVMHQMFRVRRPAWRALSAETRASLLGQASALMLEMENRPRGQSAFYSLLGHKGDLLCLHFRENFAELHEAELCLQALPLFDYLEPASSFLSVVELGLYESTTRVYGKLAEQGIEPYSEEWNREVESVLLRQREAMKTRLWPEIPTARYLCFYPMDRKRGEEKNWYQVPMAERQRMMHEHGLVGRRYGDQVRQIITGAIGFDDWEWGVDLFADDPLVFKRLIYEMRFDEVSAVYALFGTFYLGLRFRAGDLGVVLKGKLPA